MAFFPVAAGAGHRKVSCQVGSGCFVPERRVALCTGAAERLHRVRGDLAMPREACRRGRLAFAYLVLHARASVPLLLHLEPCQQGIPGRHGFRQPAVEHDAVAGRRTRGSPDIGGQARGGILCLSARIRRASSIWQRCQRIMVGSRSGQGRRRCFRAEAGKRPGGPRVLVLRGRCEGMPVCGACWPPIRPWACAWPGSARGWAMPSAANEGIPREVLRVSGSLPGDAGGALARPPSFPPQRFPERHAFGRHHLLCRVIADGCQGRRARLLPANMPSRPRVHGVGAPWPRAGVFHLVGFPGNPSIVPQALQQVLDAFVAEVHRGIVWKIVEASSGLRARCAGAACIPRHFRQGIARRQARCGSLGMAGRNRHRWRGLPAAPVRGVARARRRGFRYSPEGSVCATPCRCGARQGVWSWWWAAVVRGRGFHAATDRQASSCASEVRCGGAKRFASARCADPWNRGCKKNLRPLP